MLGAAMTPRERNFFFVAEDLAHGGRAATLREVAAQLPSYFGYAEPAPQRLVAELKRRRYLRTGRGGRLRPTRRGVRALEPAVEQYFSAGGLVKSAKSAAFRSLCFERQGLDVCQHGSLTAHQLSVLIQTAGRAPCSHLIDLGCGVGEVGFRVAEQLGTTLTGVDTSSSAISYACRHARRAGRACGPEAGEERGDPASYGDPAVQSEERRAAFIAARMEEAAFAGRSADLVVAVDSLYWVEDLEALLLRCLSWIRPGGALCILQSDFAGERGGATTLQWEETVVGDALSEVIKTGGEVNQRELEVSVVDFTEEERRLWHMTPAVCAPYTDAFSREGRLFLLRNIVREAEFLSRSVSHAPGARYLYMVRPM
ncbi:MAG: class I SAM-dependent methyltransferase [Spirochaetota bacterium]